MTRDREDLWDSYEDRHQERLASERHDERTALASGVPVRTADDAAEERHGGAERRIVARDQARRGERMAAERLYGRREARARTSPMIAESCGGATPAQAFASTIALPRGFAPSAGAPVPEEDFDLVIPAPEPTRRLVARALPTLPIAIPRELAIADLDPRRLGGSDAAAVLGLSDYGTPLSVYARIVDGVRGEESPQMRRGKAFERGIVQLWLEEHPGWSAFWLEDYGLRTLGVPGIEWLRCSLDVLLVSPDGEVLVGDAKRTRFARQRHGEPGTAQVAAYELIQLQTYLFALNLIMDDGMLDAAGRRPFRTWSERAMLLVHDYADTDEVLDWTIERDIQLGDMIQDRLGAFWRNHVAPRVPPKMDGSWSAKGWLEKRYPRPLRELRTAEPAEVDLAIAMREIDAGTRALKAQRNELANLLRERIGDAEGIEAPGVGRIYWRERQETVVREHTKKGGRELRAVWSKGEAA